MRPSCVARSAIKAAQIATGITLGLGGFWIAYSKLAIDHRLPLPPAIDAAQDALPTRGGKMAYYADRSGAGRPLVLVHSINAAASAFEMKPLFERYRGQRPVFAPDLPGFGFSSREDRVYSPRLYADALYDFLDQVVGEPADVVTLSLGGELAARTALAYPGVVRSLAMLSPSGLSFKNDQQDADPALSKRVHGLLALPLWGRALFDLLATRASIGWYLQKSFVDQPPATMEEYSFATAHQPGAEHAPLYFVSGLLFTPNARATLYSRLTMPVLVLYDRDAYVTFDALPTQIEQHPNWSAVRIAPTLGLPHWEQTAATAAALDAFWSMNEG